MALSRVLALLVCSCALVGAKRRSGKGASGVKRECEREICADTHEDYRPNCVLKCQSEACYNEVYGREELEPGEIDAKRQREFNQCQAREAREVNSKRRQEQSKGSQRKVRGSSGQVGDAQPADAARKEAALEVEL
ncbi:MAG: hypothetical protein SGPRY_009303 [Prymnesium sp.]